MWVRERKSSVLPSFPVGEVAWQTTGARPELPMVASIPWAFRLPISALVLILSMEWIHPVTSSGQEGSERFLSVMFGMSAVLLMMGLLRTSLMTGIVLRIPVVLVSLSLMYGGNHPAEWAWSYPATLNADLGAWMGSGRFSAMSTETKGLLMLCGWSMLLASVQYLVLMRRSVMLFGMGTMLYLLLLEALVGFDAFGSIVRSVLWLLSIQGLLQFLRITGGGGTYRRRARTYGAWCGIAMGSAAFLILVSTLPIQLGTVAPAERISLSRMAESLAKWAGYAPSGSIPASLSVTGYGTVDAPMGAPLTQGEEIMFTARSPKATYWRGETRSFYNGNSWSDAEQRFKHADPSGLLRVDGWENQAYWTRIRQTITMQREWRGPSPLFTGGVPVRFTFLDRNSGHEPSGRELLSNEDTGTLWLAGAAGSAGGVQAYTVDVMIPSAAPEQLRSLAAMPGSGDPAPVRRTYLQLPDTLPQRVRDLASDIVRESETRYDAVQAVKTYLGQHASYTLDTRMPPRGTDFVDDFLFVTHAGYCNHFSTAMVVLLRAEGIPARWVKGFAPGEPDPQVPDRYVITQGDAHSWVEVYFPGAGWIPFEATPGFGPAPGADAGAAAAAGQQPGEVAPPPQEHGGGMGSAGAWLHARARELAADPWPAAALAAAALLLAAGAFRMRRLRPALRLWLLLAWPRSSFPDRERLLRAAAPVWTALARRYGPRPEGMTLREYAASAPVAAGADSADVARFAADWERLLYGPERPLRADSLDFLRRALRLARHYRAS